MHWLALMAFWAAFTLALISPGPNFALMLRIGLGSGRTAALRTTLGIAVGEAVGASRPCSALRPALRYPVLGTASAGPAARSCSGWPWRAALRLAWRRRLGAEPQPPAGGFWTGFADAAECQARVLLGFAHRRAAGHGWRRRLAPLASRSGSQCSCRSPGTCSLALAFSGRRLAQLYARARRGIEGLLGAALAALGIKLLAAS